MSIRLVQILQSVERTLLLLPKHYLSRRETTRQNDGAGVNELFPLLLLSLTPLTKFPGPTTLEEPPLFPLLDGEA
jgi:hypothetical protein